MYKTWTASAGKPEQLARAVELHLNEYAGEVIAVAYAVSDRHYALVVYRELDARAFQDAESAVAVAEHIIDESHL